MKKKTTRKEPFICKRCNSLGYYKYVEGESKFIICNNCRYETAEVYCNKCDCGGEFIENIKAHPSFWNCPYCNERYELANDFYKNPTYVIDKKIKKRNESSNINVLTMLWRRKYIYLASFILIYLIGLLNIQLGEDIDLKELIVMSLSGSFIFGFTIYRMFINPTQMYRKKGRFIIFTKEGWLHCKLCIGTMILLEIIFKVLKFD